MAGQEVQEMNQSDFLLAIFTPAFTFPLSGPM